MKSEDVVEFDVQPWGVDENLVALLGEQGASEFRALFDAFPVALLERTPAKDTK